MACFIPLLGLCSLAVANPIAGAVDHIAHHVKDDFSANVSTHTTGDFSANVTTDVGAHIPLSTDYVGCYAEPLGGARALTRASLKHPALTVPVCQDFCKGYRLYGLEFGNECYCGYKLDSGAFQVPDSACGAPCIGDLTQTCGGNNLLSLYKSNFTLQVPKVDYTPKGCFAEPPNSRALRRVIATDKVCLACLCSVHAAGQHN
ncbi:hypothetical protein KVR01_002032 [Diaporthe batatas]|uniref:uncharacterized protein n=1 Tax=Diaporthe batatas TaxID=748121 RepID=UPI001D0500F1|nr:uncharacterized protein KVR01_002032 [Diaporthe batatas]KAG8166343.1 hypothetical protein KVR01_002032 [Diaporthe batatas]